MAGTWRTVLWKIIYSDNIEVGHGDNSFSAEVLQNVFPYLQDRNDWNNLSIVSKQVHGTSRQVQEKMPPPWPRDCKWPQDPSIGDEHTNQYRQLESGGHGRLPPHMMNAAVNLDAFDPVWSRDGTRIAATSNRHWLSRRRTVIHVVDQRAGHVKRWEGHGGHAVCSIDFGDGFLVSSGADRRVRKWDCNGDYECVGDWHHLIQDEGSQLSDCDDANVQKILPLKVSPDSCRVALLLLGSLRIFDSTDGAILHTISLGGNAFATSRPIFTPDGNSLIFGCGSCYGGGDEWYDERISEGCIKIWSRNSGSNGNESTPILTINITRGGVRVHEFVTDLAIARDGKSLATSGTEILLWKFGDGKLEFSDKFELSEAVEDAYKRDDVKSISFTPCEKYVVVGGGEKYEENFGFLSFFEIDGDSEGVTYHLGDFVGTIRYSSKGIGLYTSRNKTTINPNISHEEDKGDNEARVRRINPNISHVESEDENEAQSRIGPPVVGFENDVKCMPAWQRYVRTHRNNLGLTM